MAAALKAAASPPHSETMRHHGLNILAIRGGTRLSTLLRGLKRYVAAEGTWSIARLGAIVTVKDEGGSSGALRKEFGMLPPGDIRNCMVALSEDSALLARLFQHRFQTGDALLAGLEMVLHVEFGGFHLDLLRQSLGDCLTSSMCTEIHSPSVNCNTQRGHAGRC